MTITRIAQGIRTWRHHVCGACSLRRNAGRRRILFYLITLTVAGIAYLLAVREIFSTPRFPRRVIIIGLVAAALWHVPFLLMPPGSDDDVHRYVWDGRVQHLGYDPYVLVPGDPARQRAAYTRNSHAEQPGSARAHIQRALSFSSGL